MSSIDDTLKQLTRFEYSRMTAIEAIEFEASEQASDILTDREMLSST